MQELVTSLVSQLGISQSQAQGGAGAIFKAAQERLGTGQFEQLLGNVPGIKDLLAHAPSTNDGGGLGGMLGGLASLAGKMGGGEMAQAAQLLASMNSLGINKDTLMKFVPVVMKFLESKGGPQLVEQVRAALKL
jgi:Protein of unknown function VcgC/VcgE (DUF2780)